MKKYKNILIDIYSILTLSFLTACLEFIFNGLLELFAWKEMGYLYGFDFLRYHVSLPFFLICFFPVLLCSQALGFFKVSLSKGWQGLLYVILFLSCFWGFLHWSDMGLRVLVHFRHYHLMSIGRIKLVLFLIPAFCFPYFKQWLKKQSIKIDFKKRISFIFAHGILTILLSATAFNAINVILGFAFQNILNNGYAPFVSMFMMVVTIFYTFWFLWFIPYRLLEISFRTLKFPFWIYQIAAFIISAAFCFMHFIDVTNQPPLTSTQKAFYFCALIGAGLVYPYCSRFLYYLYRKINVL